MTQTPSNNRIDPATPASPGQAMPSYRRWCGLAVMLTGTFMTIMDVMIVNVALPSIRAHLGATFAEAEFIVAGYGLAYALLLITGGRLGDLYGRRKMFIVGLGAFTLTSILCGIVLTPRMLVISRLLQGAAAALLFPQVFSLIRVTFTTRHESARAFAVMGAVLGLATIVGQLLGGLLVEANLFGLTWRPVFLVNVFPGVAALLLAPYLIDESRAPGRARIDGAGVVLSTIALGMLLYPLIQGREAGWPAWSFAMLGAAAPALGAFIAHQHRKSQHNGAPLLDTSLFREPTFSLGVLVVLVFYATLNSLYLAYAFLVQTGLGRSALDAGLIFASLAVTFVAASLVAGRLARRARRSTLIVGAAITVFGNLLAAVTALFVRPLRAEDLVGCLSILGVGQGLLMTPLLNTILGGVHLKHAGAASGVLSTMQQVGGAVGVALVGIVFADTLRAANAAGLARDLAYAKAFSAAALCSAAGAFVTLCLLLLLPGDACYEEAP
jgi:EmrB/QacA subfamily drug resistance transporter